MWPRPPLSPLPPLEGAAAPVAPVAELLEGPLLAAAAAVPKVVLELLHKAEAPPETCQMMASATKATNAVMRQYSARSWPSLRRKNLSTDLNTMWLPAIVYDCRLLSNHAPFEYQGFS